MYSTSCANTHHYVTTSNVDVIVFKFKKIEYRMNVI